MMILVLKYVLIYGEIPFTFSILAAILENMTNTLHITYLESNGFFVIILVLYVFRVNDSYNVTF